MESTFASRVREYRKFKGLSQVSFAEQCGLEQGNITQMEKGTEPKQSNVAKLIAGYPDLNPDWLLLGTGPMLRDGRALTPATPAPAVAQEPEPPTEPAAGLRVNRDDEQEAYWKGLAQERLRENEFLKELLRGAYGIRPADDVDPSEPAREGVRKKAEGSEQAAEKASKEERLTVLGLRRYPAVVPAGKYAWVDETLATPFATRVVRMWKEA